MTLWSGRSIGRCSKQRPTALMAWLGSLMQYAALTFDASWRDAARIGGSTETLLGSCCSAHRRRSLSSRHSSARTGRIFRRGASVGVASRSPSSRIGRAATERLARARFLAEALIGSLSARKPLPVVGVWRVRRAHPQAVEPPQAADLPAEWQRCLRAYALTQACEGAPSGAMRLWRGVEFDHAMRLPSGSFNQAAVPPGIFAIPSTVFGVSYASKTAPRARNSATSASMFTTANPSGYGCRTACPSSS
jgi:hypothetical protein